MLIVVAYYGVCVSGVCLCVLNLYPWTNIFPSFLKLSKLVRIHLMLHDDDRVQEILLPQVNA